MRLGFWFLLTTAAICLTGQKVPRSGIHPEDMDPNCKPCTDFWRYVNGGWLDKNPIPARSSSWGTVSVLNDANQERMRTILEAAVADKSAAPGSNQRKMGDLYASCMDTAAIDARGIAPLQPDFDRISTVQSLQNLNRVLAGFQRTGRPSSGSPGVVVGAFRLISEPDPKTHPAL